MREFFLNTVVDWVESQYCWQNYLEKTGKEFGDEQMRLSLRMTTGYRNCFQDYLVFESKPVFFYFKSGLEYFIEYNPLGLDNEILFEYKEILQTQISSVFEVKRLVDDVGVELFSSELGYVFVYDGESSADFQTGDLIWARIGQVSGKYYFLSEFVPKLSLSPGVDKTHVLKSVTVKQIATTLFLDDEILKHSVVEKNKPTQLFQNVGGVDKFETTDTSRFLKTSKNNFQKIRKKMNLEKLFSIKTLNKWIDAEKEKGVDFAFKNLAYFVPESLQGDPSSYQEYIQAGQLYLNAYLLNKINKKMLEPLSGETIFTAHKIIQQLVSSTYLNSEFWDQYLLVCRPMRDMKFKESKEGCERLIERLHKSHILFWPSFKVFASAATACFMMGEFFLAIGLIEAALRLNPKYLVGKKLRKNFLRTVGVSKIKKNIINNFYSQTVFAEYEKFLSEHKAIANETVVSKDINKSMLKYC